MSRSPWASRTSHYTTFEDRDLLQAETSPGPSFHHGVPPRGGGRQERQAASERERPWRGVSVATRLPVGVMNSLGAELCTQDSWVVGNAASSFSFPPLFSIMYPADGAECRALPLERARGISVQARSVCEANVNKTCLNFRFPNSGNKSSHLNHQTTRFDPTEKRRWPLPIRACAPMRQNARQDDALGLCTHIFDSHTSLTHTYL